MDNVKKQKVKLHQKKTRLAAEEIRLNLKERKMRTRYLIEVGGLVVKAELDHLPTYTLYGALLSLKNASSENNAVQSEWTKLGKSSLEKESQAKIAVILTLTQKPSLEIRSYIRSQGLKWNKLRQEWYGYINNIRALKSGLENIQHHIEVIKQ